MKRRNDSPAVYSSELGRICPACGRSVVACACRDTTVTPPGDGIARVRREKKGRGGKTVTTVSGVPLEESALKDLAAALRRLCGAGGSIKGGVIEVQGDHAERLVRELERRGFRVKRAGG